MSDAEGGIEFGGDLWALEEHYLARALSMLEFRRPDLSVEERVEQAMRLVPSLMLLETNKLAQGPGLTQGFGTEEPSPYN